MHQLELMATFSKVVEEGSFTKAAQALNCSKAHVSQQVSRLEEGLGVQLLFRSTRKLSLTEAGETYLRFCQQIVETADEAGQALESLQGDVTGTIRISTPVSFGEVFLNDIVLAFAEEHPRTRIELDLDNRIRDLKEDNIDVAIRTSTHLDFDLVAIPVGSWREVLCASPDYVKRNSAPESPTDLYRFTCLVNSHFQNSTIWRFEQGEDFINAPIDGRLAINNFILLKQAVQAGAGIARLPSYLAKQELERGELVPLLEDFQTGEYPIYVVYAYQKAIPLKVRRFVDFVRTWFETEY